MSRLVFRFAQDFVQLIQAIFLRIDRAKQTQLSQGLQAMQFKWSHGIATTMKIASCTSKTKVWVINLGNSVSQHSKIYKTGATYTFLRSLYRSIASMLYVVQLYMYPYYLVDLQSGIESTDVLLVREVLCVTIAVRTSNKTPWKMHEKPYSDRVPLISGKQQYQEQSLNKP